MLAQFVNSFTDAMVGAGLLFMFFGLPYLVWKYILHTPDPQFKQHEPYNRARRRVRIIPVEPRRRVIELSRTEPLQNGKV